MDVTAIVVAVLSLAGTFIGTLGGILTSTKLTSYRIEQLEKKVEKHNSVVERTTVLEKEFEIVQHDIDELKNDMTRK